MSDYLEILSDTSVESIDNCIICFYPLENEIAELSCGHKYHFDCLQKWMSDSKTVNSNLCCICNKDDIEIKNVFNLNDSIEETNIDNCIDTKETKKSKSDYEPDSDSESDFTISRDALFFCCNIL